MHDDKQLEALEHELADRLGTPLEQLRAQRTHCPPIESVRALGGGALPEEMHASLRQHVDSCASCGALAADLQDDELTAPTPGEAQRITARIDGALGEAARASSASQATPREKVAPRFALLRPALAVAVVALAVWMMRTGLPPAPGNPTTQNPSVVVTPVVIPAALQLQMPELRLSAAAALVVRGESGGRQYVKDLAPAFDAYRAGKYDQAARLFAELEGKYPKGTEVFYYGGVSRLHAQQRGTALRLLRQARAMADAEFADEISFYLALASHRAGELNVARAEFEKLCAAKTEFSVRACDASRALNTPSPR